MKLTAGIVIGVSLVVVWLRTWRVVLGWALSRGDTPARRLS